jgi:hypothetical protein
MWLWPVNMPLRPGLLWLALNLAMIIQCSSLNKFRFSILHASQVQDYVMFSHVQASLREVCSYGSVRGDVMSTAQRSIGSQPGAPARAGGHLRRERRLRATGHSVTEWPRGYILQGRSWGQTQCRPSVAHGFCSGHDRRGGYCYFLVKVKVILRLTVGQSVCLGVKFTLELVTRYYSVWKLLCSLWGALSDERVGLSPVSI